MCSPIAVDGRTETLLAHAGAHCSAGRVAEAEGAYNAILDANPEEYRAHLGLAECVCARGLTDWAVDHLVENARSYAEQGSIRPAFALLTKALAIAPSRLDLHIDVAELEALDGRPEMAALRLENLARSYTQAGQAEEAELVLEAAAAFRAPPEPMLDAAPPPFVNPHTGHSTPGPRVAATPPPPPPASRARAVPRPIAVDPTPTPAMAMVRPSPLVPPPAPPARSTQVLPQSEPEPKAKPKPKRSSRGRAASTGPKWRPSTVTKDPPPRKVKPVAKPATTQVPAAKISITKAPRPRKTAQPIATYAKKRASIAPAPSPKRGGKKLDKLPPLRQPASSLAARLRAASSSVTRPPGEEDRTSMWRPT